MYMHTYIHIYIHTYTQLDDDNGGVTGSGSTAVTCLLVSMYVCIYIYIIYTYKVHLYACMHVCRLNWRDMLA